MSNNSLTYTASGARWDSVQAQREHFAEHGLPSGAAALMRSDRQKNQLLDALMYHMPMEVRGLVSQEVPAAYNAYFAKEIMAVDHAPPHAVEVESSRVIEVQS